MICIHISMCTYTYRNRVQRASKVVQNVCIILRLLSPMFSGWWQQIGRGVVSWDAPPLGTVPKVSAIYSTFSFPLSFSACISLLHCPKSIYAGLCEFHCWSDGFWQCVGVVCGFAFDGWQPQHNVQEWSVGWSSSWHDMEK